MAEPKTGPKWSKFWVTAKYVGKNTQYKVGKNFYYRSQNPFISRKYAFNQIVKKYFKIQISHLKKLNQGSFGVIRLIQSNVLRIL